MGERETLSKSKSGKLKLDYFDGANRTVVTWEPVKGGIIETFYDDIGAVTRQSLLEHEHAIDAASLFMKEKAITAEEDSNYTDVQLKKPCPQCGKELLKRVAGEAALPHQAPIMPIYVCKGCATKSYYLSDDYLEYLISNNNDKFSEQEKKEMADNRVTFRNELKEYIIRIFASKHFMRIR